METINEFRTREGYSLEKLLKEVIRHGVYLRAHGVIEEWASAFVASIEPREIDLLLKKCIEHYTYVDIDEETGVQKTFKFHFDALFIPDSEQEKLRRDFFHSPNYSSIQFKGELIKLTNGQAEIVKALHQTWKKGIQSLSHKEIEEITKIRNLEISEHFQKNSKKKFEKLISRKDNNHYSLNL